MEAEAIPLRALLAPRLFDGQGWAGPTLLHIAGGCIEALEPAPRHAPEGCLMLPDDALLAPGFIDIQVNGGGDALLNDNPDEQTIARIAQAHRCFGTTGLLPTLITDAPGKMVDLLAAAQAGLSVPGVLGFHLEGPFLNLARKGIHPAAFMRRPAAADLALLARFGRLGHSLVTLAPEMMLPEAIKALAAAGLVLSAGHSEATAAGVEAAIGAGLSGVTHLFNAMSQLTPREPGLVGMALGDERLMAGIICDGLHVAPLNLRLAYRLMGRDRLMLVSDAMPTVGGASRTFALQGRTIRLDGGRLTGPDGTLAGAHLGMIEAVRNAVTMMGCELGDALVMASGTPARFLGLDRQRGRIAQGYAADLVALRGERLTVSATSIAGEWLMHRSLDR
ncbi:MAG: N-acetylglucosamine-6-phosphate deacetylase [Hyphomicrobiales bacterium]|nr:N-acetylglucosamine-6-phosphate deacetylase [Hyphomicrobiales bacterium]